MPLPVPARATGPDGRPVEVVRYPDGDADACRKLVAKTLRGILDAGRVAASDVVVLTPRSPRSSWLMHPDGTAVEAWPYRLVPEYGPEGSVLPPPTRGEEVRVSTVHRFKGLEAPVVVLAEIDGRVSPEDLPGLLYVGATRARSHLVVWRRRAWSCPAPAEVCPRAPAGVRRGAPTIHVGPISACVRWAHMGPRLPPNRPEVVSWCAGARATDYAAAREEAPSRAPLHRSDFG